MLKKRKIPKGASIVFTVLLVTLYNGFTNYNKERKYRIASKIEETYNDLKCVYKHRKKRKESAHHDGPETR